MSIMFVREIDHGYTVEVPTFAYWFKAGIALTFGAVLVAALTSLSWFVFGVFVSRSLLMR